MTISHTTSVNGILLHNVKGGREWLEYQSWQGI